MTPPDDDLEALGQQAGGRRLGAGDAKRRQPMKPARVDAPQECLDEIVSGLSQGRSTPTSRLANQQGAEPPEDLDALAQRRPARTAGPQSLLRIPRSPPETSSTDVEGLDELIHSAVSGRAKPVRQSVAVECADREAISGPAEDLERLVPAAEKPARSARWRPPLGPSVLVLLLVMGLAFALWQRQSNKASAPASLAGQVTQLAAAVDAHYLKNQSLPRTLAELQGFPTDAVEWPIDRYGVRLLERRVEYFFAGTSAHDYVIVVRQGEEAWAFAKGQRPELLKVPAH